jgi:hypothetical protein
MQKSRPAKDGLEMTERRGHIPLMRWKVFQFAVFTAFLFSNVYFEWGIEGIAAPVMGGMLAYYLTRVILASLGRLPPVQAPECSASVPALSLHDWPASNPRGLLRISRPPLAQPSQVPLQ